MQKQPKRPEAYQYDANGEFEVQQQIMQSYQSGVVDQSVEQKTPNKMNEENQLR
ncbi:hypothetical protein ACSVDE_11415 [Pseudalkalibacillus sp. Hm43]|uniref:hypothetical protein n=1 Tax=Pseudalkalibacillus sp. Hm43 TaxID=3450742 RepID=UPI003F4274E9